YDPACAACRIFLSAVENTHEMRAAFLAAVHEAMVAPPLYRVADPAVVDMLGAIRQIYSVDVVAQAAALAAVENRALIGPVIDDVVSERAWLAGELAGIPGVRLWPSCANFLLVRVPGASTVRARLRDEHSILVRDFSYARGLEGCLRITVGTHEENECVVRALSQLVKEES
ncbi:MAG: aminotransferase class I/II-fold pyridoxal phosphate-dependent enzyme, partial [Atopobiaceae bacterium]|nr:aminotransferase class I/II-fold pyridoxal phosphate-dependent enzyme [Atopobiaceae bacterium]